MRAVRGLIVIPAFNEALNIERVLSRVHATSPDENVVVVDDGSTDGTHAVLARLGSRTIRHPINLGYVRALQTGIRFAAERGYDYLVFLDADGQHDPREIAALRKVGLAADGPDIVIGSRFVTDRAYKAPLGRAMGMLLFSWLTGAIAGQRVHDTTSGFKLMRASAYERVVDHIYGDFHSEMIIFSLLAGLRITEVPITVAPRELGVSMYGWLSALLYPFKTLLAISVLWLEARRVRRAASLLERLSRAKGSLDECPPPLLVAGDGGAPRHRGDRRRRVHLPPLAAKAHDGVRARVGRGVRRVRGAHRDSASPESARATAVFGLARRSDSTLCLRDDRGVSDLLLGQGVGAHPPPRRPRAAGGAPRSRAARANRRAPRAPRRARQMSSPARALETERLVLRPHAREDFAECAALWADPAVTRYIGGKPSTDEESWGRLLRYVGHWDVVGYGYWTVRERTSGAYVGEVGFADYRRELDPSFGGAPEAGWVLRPGAHGKGFATEAVRAGQAWLARTIGETRTVCMISPDNAPSLRVAEKCGYREWTRASYKGALVVLCQHLPAPRSP